MKKAVEMPKVAHIFFARVCVWRTRSFMVFGGAVFLYLNNEIKFITNALLY